MLSADGRAIALGGLGIGLAEPSVATSDPAAAARLGYPTIVASMQPSWGEFTLDDQSGTSTVTRFPMVGIGYPVVEAGGVVTLTLAGHMERRWVGERTRTIALGGADVVADERFETDGGTALVRLGWAQTLGERLALGVSGGLYSGRLVESFDRVLDSLSVGRDVRNYSEDYRWGYRGYVLSAGVSADPHELIHLSGAVEWSSALEERPYDQETDVARSYDVPIRVLAGASGRLAQRLVLATSMAYQDWSGAGGFESGVASGRALRLRRRARMDGGGAGDAQHSDPVRIPQRRAALPVRVGGPPGDGVDARGRVQPGAAGRRALRLDRRGHGAREPHQPAPGRVLLARHRHARDLPLLGSPWTRP